MEVITIIKSVSEFGSLGLSAFLAWIYFKMVTNHLHDTQNTIKENTAAINELKVVITKLVDFLEIKMK